MEHRSTMGNYLVTGGAGFIGSHVAQRLCELGHSVRVFDDFSSGKRDNLAEFADKIEILQGDMTDFDQCKTACTGVDMVLHQAAIPSVPKSVENPVASHHANINGTFNILRAAGDAGCKRVIYAASSSAYGDTDVSPKHEEIKPGPLSPYAVQKLTGELYGRAFYECFNLEFIALRYFNVFGPRQDPKSQYAAAIPAFVTAILAGKPPTVYGDGEQTRDFSYIENVVHANVLATQADQTPGVAVNIACGEKVSVNQVIAKINELLGTDIQPNYAPSRAGDVKHSLADISLAKRLIGFEPRVMFDEGLKRAIDYYKAAAVNA
jgi:UDP-glucose 4-epimerase